MSDFMEGIGAIVAGGGDEDYAIPLGWSGSIADNAAYTFTTIAQTGFDPERLELSVSPATARGAFVIEAFNIAGENQLGSADAVGFAPYHRQAPNMDLRYDRWPGGTTMQITVRNRSGAPAFVAGVMFGELVG